MVQTIMHHSINDYDYPLPDERIAKFPLACRDASKLLLNRNGALSEHRFSDLPHLLPADSLLMLNNTKVIQARLIFEKETGAQIEIFCLEPHAPSDYALAFQQKNVCEWKCLIGNLKRWKNGIIRAVGNLDLHAERIAAEGNLHIVRFSWNDASLNFSDILDRVGELPIPPYLHRATCEKDKETYQTVYSKVEGSVAAPTAGLHFTENVFAELRKKGIETEKLTLHVGAGTFQPIKSDTITEHAMHVETISVQRETIAHLLKKMGKIVAVGTTSVRTLESLYFAGARLEENPDLTMTELHIEQWAPYQQKNTITAEKALRNLLGFLEKNKFDALQIATRIMIVPSYEFKIVNAIITNFHQPKSTLLLLIAAYLGGDWRKMYDFALARDFRFLSYGDSSLLMRD